MTGEGKEFMMPTPAEGAALRFFIEEVKGLREDFRQEREERKEERQMLRDVRDEVIRHPARDIAKDLRLLSERVVVLETDKHHRDGAVGVGNWFAKNGSNLVALVATIVLLVYFALRASGRI